ncbi:TerC family protein [Undibacterium sp. SXout11W]|uniref:TerC family protein n=1 Tax=Undibacterium sp. SXout11W TaxID=3413050 RepID=UPI003BF397F8
MMGFDGIMHAIAMTLQVFFLDLVLSGDNAVLIALACRRLPQKQMRQVILLGTGFAFFLRVVLTTVVSFLLQVPSLRLIGGVALVYIALKLLVDDEQNRLDGETCNHESEQDATNRLWSTVGIVVVADLVMSMDNVVALAAVAQDNVSFLVFGLLLSIPLLMYGSLFVTGLLNRYPILVPAVAALLGWIAGDIAVADPLIADWINTQSPGLTVVMPLLCAVFVLMQSRIVKELRQTWGINLDSHKKTDISARILAMTHTPVVVEHPEVGQPEAESKIIEAQQAANLERVTELPVAASAVVVADHSVTNLNAGKSQDQAPPAPATLAKTDAEQNDEEESEDGEYEDNNESTEDQSGGAGWLQKLRENGLLIGGLCLTGLMIFVFTHFGKSFIPAPAPMTQFECPGYTGKFSLYYKHGGEKIQIRTAGRVINGSVNYGKLQWENYPDISTSIGFSLPVEIVSDSGRSVQINGGSFRQISCSRID